jgi:hypothetical protein
MTRSMTSGSRQRGNSPGASPIFTKAGPRHSRAERRTAGHPVFRGFVFPARTPALAGLAVSVSDNRTGHKTPRVCFPHPRDQHLLRQTCRKPQRSYACRPRRLFWMPEMSFDLCGNQTRCCATGHLHLELGNRDTQITERHATRGPRKLGSQPRRPAPPGVRIGSLRLVNHDAALCDLLQR